jgi:hypothetical protein
MEHRPFEHRVCQRLVVAIGICSVIAGCGEAKHPKTASGIINGYPVAMLYEPGSDALAYGFVAIPSFRTATKMADAQSADVVWVAPHLEELWIHGARVPKDELTGFFVIWSGKRMPIELSAAELEELTAAGVGDLDKTKAWRERVLPFLERLREITTGADLS